jgi:hypothetical protein
MPTLFDESQAADWLNIRVKTLQSWRVKGGGPRFVKIGRLVRYSEDDLKEFIDQWTVANTSEATQKRIQYATNTNVPVDQVGAFVPVSDTLITRPNPEAANLTKHRRRQSP